MVLLNPTAKQALGNGAYAMSLAVILLNWHHERQTIRCACTISAWQELKPRLYVVDNESTEATRRALAAGLGSASLICSPLNLGYAGGNNLGIRQALSAHCQYILLHNSDAEISEGGVTRLLARLKANPQISVLGPLMHETRNGRPHLLAGGRNIACYPRTRTPMDPSDLKVLPGYPIYAVDYVPGTIFWRVPTHSRRTACLMRNISSAARLRIFASG